MDFCTNTFTWGDYIDRVWDIWIKDKRGRLFVGESVGKRIALAHVHMCPAGIAWLEGIRVHPDFRRIKVATTLLQRMLVWASKSGAREAAAIVSQENIPSQKMMLKNDFSAISEWAYYSINEMPEKSITQARIATTSDLEHMWRYLQKSRNYRLSAGRYVSSWQWYRLDKEALRHLVMADRVIVTGRPVDGLAILNKTGYWDRPDVLQIVYIDPSSTKSLQNLLNFATNLCSQGYSRLHILCCNNKKITSTVEKFRIEESEIFLLYNKKVFTQ